MTQAGVVQDLFAGQTRNEALKTSATRALPARKQRNSVHAELDGHRSAAEVCAPAGAGAWSRLIALRERAIVMLGITLPTACVDPLGALRTAVSELPEEIADRWRLVLDDLASDLEGFAGSDLGAKPTWLTRIEANFRRISRGRKPRRRPGQTYADRLTIYEEARGDIATCVVGPELEADLVRRMAPALDLSAAYSTVVQASCRRRAGASCFRARGDGSPQPFVGFLAELQEAIAPRGLPARPGARRVHLPARVPRPMPSAPPVAHLPPASSLPRRATGRALRRSV